MHARATVHIVDDDDSVRRALGRILTAHGHMVSTFGSAQAFLEEADLDAGPACVLLDLMMPGMDGLMLQRVLQRRVPVIFLSGHGDVTRAVQAMQAGAIEFLEKPVSDTDLLAAVEKGCVCAADLFARERELRILREKIDRLTPREREVLTWVVTGIRNKQVASELGTVEKTIKVHRAHVMQKLEVDSLPALVRIADRMGLCAARRESPWPRPGPRMG
ncbi:response regulator transcription factor [Cupriavidus plantarum]|uniref:response regulator transcription factor n=1 Tax=Cupriavidus plantarum TaxID=942865 RepID=UPI001B0F2D37|nr:response regulator [Cupriavidus plantarum]CAG2139831.1 Response regulator protein TodT [Cupriavidus plantarum]SMR85659.1 two component transcriptional regulator, LuxR family [Cupriavidus plantarum]